MNEFMIFIKKESNPVTDLVPEQQQEHVQKIGEFIGQLVKKGKMKDAQPLEMEGAMLSYRNGDFIDEPFNKTDEVISGYYHIIAKDLKEAVETAKSDPRFKDGEWRMEIRPIMEIEGIN